MEFAKGRDVVETGIGSCVRDHDQPVPHQNSAAIGHSRSSNASDRENYYLISLEAPTPFGHSCRALRRFRSGAADIDRLDNDPSNPGDGAAHEKADDLRRHEPGRANAGYRL